MLIVWRACPSSTVAYRVSDTLFQTRFSREKQDPGLPKERAYLLTGYSDESFPMTLDIGVTGTVIIEKVKSGERLSPGVLCSVSYVASRERGPIPDRAAATVPSFVLQNHCYIDNIPALSLYDTMFCFFARVKRSASHGV